MATPETREGKDSLYLLIILIRVCKKIYFQRLVEKNGQNCNLLDQGHSQL